MIVRQLKHVRSGPANVKSDGWESARMLLRNDGMGFSLHVTKLSAGCVLRMHYQNHLEAVFVVEGTGTIEDLATGEIHPLRPGVVYALNEHDRHIVRPTTDIVTVCVFNPPLSGLEVHDENGSYPLSNCSGLPVANTRVSAIPVTQ